MMRGSNARGGAWLVAAAEGSVFTPEAATDEHRLVRGTAARFCREEVLPALPRLEAKDWTIARMLLARSGELGLLGAHVPEAYGGIALDQVSSFIISEALGAEASFGATFGAQANLCIMPILLFGSPEQKARYLPALAAGTCTGAYALSEAGSGSDALSARTTAVRMPDGSYRVSGEKLWITNGGFADVFVVFARIDGEHFSAFIVERAFGGVTSGEEEHKMGLHGSSTTPVVLQDVPVPTENLLGEAGRGHKVAFTVLNFGRLKLGAMCLGGCRAALHEALRYAAARRQFGQPIAAFGAIQHKLGEMACRTFALESLLYRAAGALDAALDGTDGQRALTSALDDLAIEASIAKIAGSETLGDVLDENVQIHGGNGYVSDYPAERRYRDARVNRIFEGTNEINRLLIPALMLKRIERDGGAFAARVAELHGALTEEQPPRPHAPAGHALPFERRTLDHIRGALLLVVDAALDRIGRDAFLQQQELLLSVADIAIDLYAGESAVLRAEASAAREDRRAAEHATAARLFAASAARRTELTAREAFAALLSAATLDAHLAWLHAGFRPFAAVDTIALRRSVAAAAMTGAGLAST